MLGISRQVFFVSFVGPGSVSDLRLSLFGAIRKLSQCPLVQKSPGRCGTPKRASPLRLGDVWYGARELPTRTSTTSIWAASWTGLQPSPSPCSTTCLVALTSPALRIFCCGLTLELISDHMPFSAQLALTSSTSTAPTSIQTMDLRWCTGDWGNQNREQIINQWIHEHKHFLVFG